MQELLSVEPEIVEEDSVQREICVLWKNISLHKQIRKSKTKASLKANQIQ